MKILIAVAVLMLGGCAFNPWYDNALHDLRHDNQIEALAEKVIELQKLAHPRVP